MKKNNKKKKTGLLCFRSSFTSSYDEWENDVILENMNPVTDDNMGLSSLLVKMHSCLLPLAVSMVMTLYRRSLSWSNEGWTNHVGYNCSTSDANPLMDLHVAFTYCEHVHITWSHFSEKGHGLIMGVLHTGTFLHVHNMQQQLIPKQLTMYTCKVFAVCKWY